MNFDPNYDDARDFYGEDYDDLECYDEAEENYDSMDGDHESALASAGFGTDEDYGYYYGEPDDDYGYGYDE